MPITPIPALDRTSPTFKADVDAFFGSQLPAFAAEANALQADVNSKQTTASNAATTAATQAGIATTKAAATSADAVATAADRVQTGLDRAATANSATAASNFAVYALASENAAAASAASVDAANLLTKVGNLSGLTDKAAARANLDLDKVANVGPDDMPVSEAQRTELDLKADLDSPTFTGTVSGITKAMVDLDKVANVGPDDMPVSTLQAAAINARSGHFYKLDKASAAFTKTGSATLSIKAGTEVATGSALIKFADDTAITMPALAAGTDYSIWVKPDDSAVAVADSFAAPASAPVTGAVKIGGFHYGLVAAGTTVASGSFATSGTGMIWTQADVDRIAGINAYSIWDLQWRAAGEQHGFALDPYARVWAPIYWPGTNHSANGLSKYNTDIASGAVLPKKPLAYGGNGAATYADLNWWTANEIAQSHGCRLPTEQEFNSLAFGVTENQSLGGASATPPATIRQPGYTSRIGLEQATGHIWAWGSDSSYVADGDPPAGYYNVSGGRGQLFLMNSKGLVRALLGGARVDAALSGSRSSRWDLTPWSSAWNIGVRAVSDHINTASGAM